MRPTVGVPDVCPPLCKMIELNDGTYTLADVERMNQTIAESLDAAIKARSE